jgi:hypothetical protein
MAAGTPSSRLTKTGKSQVQRQRNALQLAVAEPWPSRGALDGANLTQQRHMRRNTLVCILRAHSSRAAASYCNTLCAWRCN